MRRQDAPGGEAGFTIIEMVVALFVMVELILAVLLLFDFSNKLSRVQSNVADMQQSLRVSQYDTVRLVRMVGRGGLPFARAADRPGGRVLDVCCGRGLQLPGPPAVLDGFLESGIRWRRQHQTPVAG